MYIVVIPRKEKCNLSLFHDWILLFYLFGETQAAVATSHDIIVLYCWQCQLVVTCPADAQAHPQRSQEWGYGDSMEYEWDIMGQMTMITCNFILFFDS
jgi:hypothetical protein